MLKSFIGTFDATGLRSLKSEEDSLGGAAPHDSLRFWAVLDSTELPSIETALMLGHRRTAFELLAQSAKSLGHCVA